MKVVIGAMRARGKTPKELSRARDRDCHVANRQREEIEIEGMMLANHERFRSVENNPAASLGNSSCASPIS